MPLNFPTTGLTANETTYTYSDNTWIWNGYAWDSVVTPISVGITGYVFSVNGLTGVVTGIAVTGSNTFTGLQTMNAGISASSLYVSGGITSSPYSFVDGIPLNPVVLDSAKIQLGDLNGAGENVKLIIDNYEGNNIRAYGTFRVYNDLYSNNIYSDWIRPSSGLSIKIGNDGSSIVIGDDGVVNNTKIVIHDPTQTLNVVNANGIINIGDVNNVGNSTKLIVDDTTNTVTINGNLTVSGGITSTFSETVLIEDNFILLNSNLTAGGPTADAGIEISRGASANVQLRWNETTDRWQFTNDGTQFYDLPTSVVSSWNGSTGAVTFSDYVVSVNGSTGAIVSVAVTGANTFTGLQTMNAGITSSTLFVSGGATFSSRTTFSGGLTTNNLFVSGGATFSANTTFLSGIQTDSVLSTNGAGGTVYINSDSTGNGGNSITIIGDWNNDNNGTSITVDDQSAAISLNGGVICNSNVNAAGFITTGDVYFGLASAFLSSQSTTLGTTAANQNIASVEINDGVVDTNRSVEFFVQASHSSGYEALKIMVIHDGTNTYNTQYGLIRTGSSLCSSYTTTITNAGSVLRLRATPTNTNTTFKVVETVIPV